MRVVRVRWARLVVVTLAVACALLARRVRELESRELTLELYDVTDLVSDGDGATKSAELVGAVRCQLGELRRSVEASGGFLIVRAWPREHEAIAALLEALRRPEVMATVEGRFIEVDDAYLERVGIHLR